MPASALGWPSPSRSPVFQLFGKRKAATMTNVEAAPQQQDWQSMQDAKRRCTWQDTAPQMDTDMTPGEQCNNNMTPGEQCNNNMTPGEQCNNNNVQQPDHMWQAQLLSQQVSQQAQAAAALCQGPEMVKRAPSPWPIQSVISQPTCNMTQPPVDALNGSQAQSLQSHHIMDMNDETFNMCASAEVQAAACMTMDSDFTPNPHQYSSQCQQNDVDDNHCQDYCGAGDASPTSGRVRCYCKPSWEGIGDLRPYISDIY